MTHEIPQEEIVQSFNDIEATYPGEWVLTKITKFDEYHTPIEGVVFAHSQFDGEVTKELQRAREENPGEKFAFKKAPPTLVEAA